MGLTHLDAGVIIGFLDGDDAHHETSRAALSSATEQGDHLCIAASALAECLVGPARHSANAVEVVRAAIHRLPVTVVNLDEELATQAAMLCARHQTLKLPDALVIATTATSGADQLITTDRKWPSAKTMKTRFVVEQI